MKNPILTYIQNWQVNSATSLFSGPAILLAFFFVSCEEPIEVEGDLVPGGNSTEIRYVEIPLEMNHTAYDSLIVSTNAALGSRGQIFVGQQSSPEIGDFSAQAYFGALLSGDVIRDSVPDNATAVVTRLKLGFNYYYGTDFGNPQNLVVSQLSDTLAISGSDYSIYDEIPVDRKISLENPKVITPGDTIVDYVELTNSFGDLLLDQIRNDDLNSVEIYNFLKGFKIEAEGSNENIFGISLENGRSFLEVVYESPTLDTLKSVVFNLSGSSFTQVNYSPGSLIPADYSGKKSFSLNDPEKAYFNSMMGISPRINLDQYLNFLDTVDFLQINKAELVIANSEFFQADNESSQIRPASNIFPYILEEDGTVEKVGEDFWALQANFNQNGGPANPNQASAPAVLTYDADKKEIRTDISFYLQEIYNNPNLWKEENSFMFTGQLIRRNSEPFNEEPTINLGNFDNFLVDKEDIRLKIYYTTFK